MRGGIFDTDGGGMYPLCKKVASRIPRNVSRTVYDKWRGEHTKISIAKSALASDHTQESKAEPVFCLVVSCNRALAVYE